MKQIIVPVKLPVKLHKLLMNMVFTNTRLLVASDVYVLGDVYRLYDKGILYNLCNKIYLTEIGLYYRNSAILMKL